MVHAPALPLNICSGPVPNTTLTTLALAIIQTELPELRRLTDGPSSCTHTVFLFQVDILNLASHFFICWCCLASIRFWSSQYVRDRLCSFTCLSELWGENQNMFHGSGREWMWEAGDSPDVTSVCWTLHWQPRGRAERQAWGGGMVMIHTSSLHPSIPAPQSQLVFLI